MKKWKILSCVGFVALMAGLYLYGAFDYVRMAEKHYVTFGACPNPFVRNLRKCIDCGYPVVEIEKSPVPAKMGLTHSDIVHKLDSILHLGDKIKYDSISGNVNLCSVVFHVNVYDGRMNLMTSVQPESRQMRKLVKAIAKNYGEPYIEENTSYHWPSVLYPGVELEVPYIRIRRIHTDEGGSVMFFK